MGQINQGGNAPMNTLKPQPGQENSYNPKFHPLPGDWAKEQLASNSQTEFTYQNSGSTNSRTQTELQKALSAENKRHEYWEDWQGVKPGKAEYEDPRSFQNTLLPTAKYGTEGRGY